MACRGRPKNVHCGGKYKSFVEKNFLNYQLDIKATE
jgi:hypothetical protein